MMKSPERTSADSNSPRFTVVIPCLDERLALEETLASLRAALAGAEPYELIFVNDGSTDGTGEMLDIEAARDPALRVVHHAENRGYGAALKSGIRRARAPWIVITDADGTYPNERIPEMVAAMDEADMVVGERTGPAVTYSPIRKLPKWFLLRYVSYLAGRRIRDMNSGLRVFRKDLAERYWNLLPDGFSFTTTITLALLTNGYEVTFLPIDYAARVGKSKIRPIRDTLGFTQLILRTGMYFAPLKVLLPLALLLGLACLGTLAYDVWVLENLTDKTILLALFSLNTGLFALIADMIDKRLGR